MRKPSSTLAAVTSPTIPQPINNPDETGIVPVADVSHGTNDSDGVHSVHSVHLHFEADRWTWNQTGIPEQITRVQINSTIKQWMQYYPAFHNWVKTCIAMHVENQKGMESVCTIPDLWRKEIGGSITIVTANMLPGEKRWVDDGNPQHVFSGGVIHVMA